MLFSSVEYGLFVAATWLLYRLAGASCRVLVLLAASYLFYASFQAYYLLLVIVLVTLTSYVAGLAIHREQRHKSRQRYLIAGVTSLVLILAGLKYLPFLFSNLNLLLSLLPDYTPLSSPPLLVTIGISYYTFQAIAYLSDVYLDIIPAESELDVLALSYAFFPKLLQGPIERGGHLLPQLKQPAFVCYADIRHGLLLFVWGLLLKGVIADNLATFVDPVYASPADMDGGLLMMASYAYSWQIFFDFSGYTAMALGVARLFGIRLSENFNQPYLATSIADFWRRWHMTFSRFILDYIFKPLQMRWRHKGTRATALALLITFFVSGLWHGASWNFIVWGVLHGALMVLAIYWRPWQKRWFSSLRIDNTPGLKCVQIVVTFHLICLLWVFFRSASIGDALVILENIFQPTTPGAMLQLITEHLSSWQALRELLLDNPYLLIFALVLTNPLTFRMSMAKLQDTPVFVRWPLYYLLIFTVLLMSNDEDIAFIYLQF